MDSNRSLTRGAVAGALAASAVVVWFFLFDLAQGEPFATPSFLAATVIGGSPLTVGAGAIAAYTLVHYAVFIALGVLIAWIVNSGRLAPGVVMGLILGLVFFDLMFYTSLSVSGVDVLPELGWPWVLAGNLIAGLVMVGWLRFTSPYPVKSWGEILSEHRIVREGIVSGVIGGTAVAIWFLIFDAATRQVLFTPAALGSALFNGADSTAGVQITAATVLGYTALHFTAFLLIGFVAAAMLVLAEREPGMLIAFVLVFVTLEASVIGFISLFANWILNSIGGWNVVIGNVVAAVAMGWYLWRAHPNVRHQYDGRSLEDAAAAR